MEHNRVHPYPPRPRVPVGAIVAVVGLVALVILVRELRATFDPIEREQRAAAAWEAQQRDVALSGLDVFVAGAWRLMPLALLAGAATVAGLIAYRRWGATEIIRAEHVTAAIRASRSAGLPDRIESLTYHDSHRAIPPAVVEPPVLAEPAPIAVPTFGELVRDGFQPTPHKMLLGVGAEKPIHGTISQLLSTAIAGRPGQGKSTLLRLIYAQTMMAGGQVAMLDPHGGIVESVAGAPSLFVASSTKELDDGAGWITSELDRRLEQYRRGKRNFDPILILCDEFPVIRLSSKAAIEAAGRVVLEGRKVGTYALISGQGMPADSFNGSLVRDALSSRYVFRTTPAEARRAGLDTDTARLVAALDPGRAILDGPTPAPMIVGIPNVTADDLVALLTSRPPAPTSERPFGFRPGSERGTARLDAEPLAEPPTEPRGTQHQKALSPRAMHVLQLLAEKRGTNEIIKEVWRVEGKGHAYQKAVEEFREILAEIAALVQA